MNVRNDLLSIQPITGENQVSAVEKSSTIAHSSSSTTASDQAHLSSAAALISHAASLSDVRAEKVQAIQSSIANGSYNISSTDVAQSLMGSMLGN
jgi:negative regulator of flagellin synthesis FlgM